jgi:1-deoxy-D-xylulose-5-phosphate reductoisomerase
VVSATTRLPRSDLRARTVVALPLIALALFLVIEGGIVFTFGLFLLGCVCMHELYGMFERAQPVRLAGFLALAGMLLAANYGGRAQVMLAAVAALPVLFGLTLAQRHPSVGGMTLTLLGIFWIGFGLAHAVLLRGLPHGEGIVIDVLVGTFLGDTGAYLGGRLFGRKPLASKISPNKTVGVVRRALPGLAARLPRARAGARRGGVRADRRPVRVVRQARGGSQGRGARAGRPWRRARPPGRRPVHGGRRLLHLGGLCLDRRRSPRWGPGLGWPSPGRLAMSKRLLVLGSTGSIGTQALDVLSRSDDLELVGLSAERSWRALVEQARAHRVRRVAIADVQAAHEAAEAWPEGEVLSGPEGLVRLVVESRAELVLNALVGSAGLGPTVATLGEGIDLALANKESLVVAGELVVALAQATGAQIVPVDSEHTALHQLLAGQPAGTAERLTITASGGPFRGHSREQLENVTVEQALAHPTWEMGGKITIDSATLMNKGLEVMEAHHLFGVPYERIDVVVHPQSLVHGIVQMADGAMLAHLGPHDMRIAISYALHGAMSIPLPVQPLDLVEIGKLTFEPVDVEAFPCLRLAREAAEAGGTAPCVLNAANEIAVHAFLSGRLPFADIPKVIEHALDTLGAAPVRAFESLYEADREARDIAEEAVVARA